MNCTFFPWNHFHENFWENDFTEIFVELVSYFCRYSPLVRLLCHYGCDPAAEDDTGHNALHYALKRGSREMVEDIIDALSEPLRLDFICR